MTRTRIIRREHIPFVEIGRTDYVLQTFPEYLTGQIADLGAGPAARHFRPHLGDRYTAIDRHTWGDTDLQLDFEKLPLPFEDNAFDTVLCMDTLEHVDNPDQLLEECTRITRRYVIISLPNNWSGFLWKLLVGGAPNPKRYANIAYGLPPQPELEPEGRRHKWFFNTEDAVHFLTENARRLDMNVVDLRCVLDKSTSGIFYCYPYPDILGISLRRVREKRPHLLVPFILIKYGLAVPFSWIEEIFKQAVWGWGGEFRYMNLFCRGIWIVLEKQR